MSKIAELVLKLTDAKAAYYAGSPIMDDATFDALEDELRRLDPGNTFLKKVGAPVPVGGAWPKVKHNIPMTSLNKAQNATDMDGWFKSCALGRNDEFFATDKMDGMSIELTYENLVLVRAATRGDGKEGEDITRNVKIMKGAVKRLPAKVQGVPVPAKVFIRGEIVCFLSDFKANFPGESNPRNTATGTSKRQSDASKCAHLTVVGYQYLPEGRAPASKAIEFAALKEIGFVTPRFKVCKTLDEVEALYEDYKNTIRASLDYLIDGLVVDINDTVRRESQGYLGDNPKGAVAYKFPHEKKLTTLKDIRWQVGNSGRITPVAEFDSVNLAGANVKQASLHNISNIEEIVGAMRKGDTLLRMGDQIMVSRRNDVIPYVEAVVASGSKQDAIPVPGLCPSCKGPLVRDGEYLVCKSDDCEAQATGAIKRWITKIGVLHFGESLIEALIEAKMVEDPADLYTLDPVAVSELEMGGRKVGGTGEKAIRNLQAKKTLPLHVLVGSLGIPMIGRSMAKTIVDAGYNSLQKMFRASVKDIASIPGVGPSKAEFFVHGFEAKMGLISKLLGNGIQVQIASGPLVSKSFCMTGFRDAALADALEKAGGSMKSGVSRDLTFLIAADPTSNSGKAQKARSYGTEVIGADEAWKMAGGKP